MCAPHKMSFMFSIMSPHESSRGSSDVDVCMGRLTKTGLHICVIDYNSVGRREQLCLTSVIRKFKK